MFFGFLLVLIAVSDVSNAFGQCLFDDSQLMTNSTSRNALEANWPKFEKRRGTTIVPYYFNGRATRQTRRVMKHILKRVEKGLGSSCPIKFKQRWSSNRNYASLEISQESRYCGHEGVSGYVTGYKSKVQLVMGSSPCYNDVDIWKQVALHEMFHVFGIAHTQRRQDRNNYIRVIQRNIEKDARSQYDICYNCKIPRGIPYECNSIMHYRDNTFAKYRNRPTMKSVNSRRCPQHHLHRNNGQPTHNDWRSLRAALGCRY